MPQGRPHSCRISDSIKPAPYSAANQSVIPGTSRIFLVCLQVTVIRASNPKVPGGKAVTKSIAIVWKGEPGGWIGSRLLYS
jgi:hypothetical protein